MKYKPCGKCVKYCTALGIDELNKYAGVKCQYLCDKGCGIYRTNPKVYTSFQCIWTKGEIHVPGVDNDELRPDKCGLLFVDLYNDVFKENVVYVFETKLGELDYRKALVF